MYIYNALSKQAFYKIKIILFPVILTLKNLSIIQSITNTIFHKTMKGYHFKTATMHKACKL